MIKPESARSSPPAARGNIIINIVEFSLPPSAEKDKNKLINEGRILHTKYDNV